jgi:hypothetical protein
MTRELRRFTAKTESGVSYLLVESASFVLSGDQEIQHGVSSFTTSTGWPVAKTENPGEYRIERLRLIVQARRSAPLRSS